MEVRSGREVKQESIEVLILSFGFAVCSIGAGTVLEKSHGTTCDHANLLD